jgi:hypothetical protein
MPSDTPASKTTQNNWPFPDQPGVPLEPEKTREHWLNCNGKLLPFEWLADNERWHTNDEGEEPDSVARWAVYEGPCLTPAEHAAAVEKARAEGELAALEGVRREMMGPLVIGGDGQTCHINIPDLMRIQRRVNELRARGQA